MTTPTDAVLYGACDIQRDSNDALNSYGEYMPDWATVATGVKCSIQPTRDREHVRGASVIRYDYTAYLKYADATPQRGDRIINYDVGGETSSVVYEVVAVMDASGKRHHWKCACNEVDI